MEVYRHPSAMEPLLPKERSSRLSELTCEILKASGRLTGQIHSPCVLKRVADLVREMNCYYSNLIEGHKTIPRDIERAMKRDFSHDQTQRDNQQLSLSHIERMFEKRHRVIDAVSQQIQIPQKLLHKAKHYYALRNKLHVIHERATVGITDADVDNYRSTIEQILTILFGLSF